MLKTIFISWPSTEFYIIVSIILVSFLLLVLYFKRRSQQLSEKIRQSLSDDIHDEIGSLLTKTAMRAELLRNKLGGDNSELYQIEYNLREAVQSMRNLLWTFDQGQNRTSDFIQRIRHTVEFIFADTDFCCMVTDSSSRLYFDRPFEVKRNILFIIKELANNTLKHSNGNRFEIVVRYKSGKWKLNIADNGCLQNYEKPLVMKGKGIKSTIKRMQLMNGKVSFHRDENGFFTELVF